MAEIIIIGAGISGLASAWFLKQRGHQVQILEAGAQPGGCLRSEQSDGFLVEAGPNSTLDRGDALGELVQALGLEQEMLEANRAARRRYILKDNRPVPLPGGPVAFFKTPLFSTDAKLRLLLEPFHGRATKEESVAEFVRRRLGHEFLDWAVDPFISGVYAGDAEALSVRAATARIYALEAEYGSLILGAIMRMIRGRRSGPAPSGRLISFRRGMQSLPNAIADALGDAVHLQHAATHLSQSPGGRWSVRANDMDYSADHVVLAAPAYHAAELLASLDATMADSLSRIAYPPVASIALGFARNRVAHPLDGFGMLIPRCTGLQTLGVLFSSTLFPGRAPDHTVLLTAFIGGARNTKITDREDTALATHVLQDLRPSLGIQGEPVFSRVRLWPHAIPQYELGHLDRLAGIDTALARWPGLHLRANWRDGISVADCLNSAKALAETIGPG